MWMSTSRPAQQLTYYNNRFFDFMSLLVAAKSMSITEDVGRTELRNTMVLRGFTYTTLVVGRWYGRYYARNCVALPMNDLTYLFT